MTIPSMASIKSALHRRRSLAVALILPLALVITATACGSKAASAPAADALTPVPPAALTTSQPPTPRPGSALAAATGPSITIDNFSFTPATITVPVGGTVTWTNHDDVPHTVTASDNSYTSQPLDSDTQFTHTYTTAGTYNYFCAIHPFMTAKVV
ncbi:MAG: cupredoxin domain-containing protein, partial [Dehalococcoidia bacterium]